MAQTSWQPAEQYSSNATVFDASVSSANLDNVSSFYKVKSFAGIAPPVSLQAPGCCLLPCHLHAHCPAPPCGLNDDCCSHSCCMLPGLLSSPDSLHGHRENILHSSTWISHEIVDGTAVCLCFLLNIGLQLSQSTVMLFGFHFEPSLNIVHADSGNANAAPTAAEMRQCVAAGTQAGH